MHVLVSCVWCLAVSLVIAGDHMWTVTSYEYRGDEFKPNEACKITFRNGETIVLKHMDIEVTVGTKLKLRCASLPEKKTSVEWSKNGEPLKTARKGRIIMRHKKKRKAQRLVFRKTKLSDSGCYSCHAPRDGSMKLIMSWKLIVNYRRKFHNPRRSFNKRCGRPRAKQLSSCHQFTDWTHPNCNSFPGLPENLQAMSFLYNGIPVVQVIWEPPKYGSELVWGYQVHLLGMTGDANHYKCVQINSRDERLYWTFSKRIRPDSTYRLFVQSLPAMHYGQRKNIASVIVNSASTVPITEQTGVEKDVSVEVKHRHHREIKYSKLPN